MYLASQRKEFILKTLAEHGAARTIALAKQMKVTDETVRNDLINLEKRGFLKRVHGGALALTHKSLHEDIVTQDDVSIRIAKKAVQNIPASVVMFIDSSTMGYQICNHINSRDTHVVSNNPTLLTRLEGIPNLSFYCTGGRFDREALVYVGQEAAKAAGSLSIDMVVLTPDCYSPKHGAGYKNMLQSEFIKSVIPPDAKVIIAMPSTSVANNPAFYTVAPSQISMLITDEALSPEMADQIEKSGVKVELCLTPGLLYRGRKFFGTSRLFYDDHILSPFHSVQYSRLPVSSSSLEPISSNPPRL